MDTEAIDRLFLELSQFTKAKTKRELALEEVMHWAQATLTCLNVGDVKSGSPLHLKLREVMIAYRDKMGEAA
jgi:hypothetical protein